MTKFKFIVFPINPATKTLCKNKKNCCDHFINGFPSDMIVKSCGLWRSIIKNGKRCRVCLDHETEVDLKDEVFNADRKGKRKRKINSMW